MPEPIPLPWPADPGVFEHLLLQYERSLWPREETAAGIMRMATPTVDADGFPVTPAPWDVVQDLISSVPEPLKVIRLTQQQMDAIPRADNDLIPRAAPWFAYAGVPVEHVDDVTESTPWIEGWVRCPVCGTSANGHPGESGCAAVIIAHGQHVQAVLPRATEVGRRALAVYDPLKFGWHA